MPRIKHHVVLDSLDTSAAHIFDIFHLLVEELRLGLVENFDLFEQVSDNTPVLLKLGPDLGELRCKGVHRGVHAVILHILLVFIEPLFLLVGE